MSYDPTMDFNSAEPQSSVLIPHGTLAKVTLSVQPGGAGPDGWITPSRTSEALYLNTEAVVLEGPYTRRRVFTRIGLKGKSVNEKGEDTYANRGRSLIRGILESARGIKSSDQSEQARAARTIGSYGDLNGLVFVARIVVESDRGDPTADKRNAVGAAIGPDRAEYAALMGGAPAPIPNGAGVVAQEHLAPTGPAATPPWAGQPPVPAVAAPAAPPSQASDSNVPFWAR
jgi:hypothetical protein